MSSMNARRARWFLPASILLGSLVACGGSGSGAQGSPCHSLSGKQSPTASSSPSCVVVGADQNGRSAEGTYRFTLTQPIPEAGGTQIQTAALTMKLTVEGDHVTGTMQGPTTQQLTQPACPSGTITPGMTSAEVEGTITGGALELQVVNATWQQPDVEPCPGAGKPALLGEGIPSGIDGFEESLSSLPKADDGTYRYDHTETRGVGRYPYTVEYHIQVRLGG